MDFAYKWSENVVRNEFIELQRSYQSRPSCLVSLAAKDEIGQILGSS